MVFLSQPFLCHQNKVRKPLCVDHVAIHLRKKLVNGFFRFNNYSGLQSVVGTVFRNSNFLGKHKFICEYLKMRI